MRVMVIGGTGLVGSNVVRELLAHGKQVGVLTRSPEKAASISGEAHGVVGDLSHPETLAPALKDIDAVFMATALAPDETEQGLAAVNAAKKAGVRRFVYMTVHQAERFPNIPHFASKYPVMAALRNSGMEYTFLAPSSFFQNDLRAELPIMKYGVYPHPFGDAGISAVDVRDIADAAVKVLTEPVHNGRTYSVVGPEVLTATAMAETWGRHLGREVRYAGNDLKAWAEQVKPFIPEWMVHDLAIMYETFQREGFQATDEEVQGITQLLGHKPRRFEDFVAETAAEWKRHASETAA